MWRKFQSYREISNAAVRGNHENITLEHFRRFFKETSEEISEKNQEYLKIFSRDFRRKKMEVSGEIL